MISTASTGNMGKNTKRQGVRNKTQEVRAIIHTHRKDLLAEIFLREIFQTFLIPCLVVVQQEEGVAEAR